MVRNLRPPFAPMEALSVDEVPVGPEWQYEPKWDGFRCLVFRDGDTITLQSKSGKPLTRYFPDVVEAVPHSRPRPSCSTARSSCPKARCSRSTHCCSESIRRRAACKTRQGNAGDADRVRSAAGRRWHRAIDESLTTAASGWRRLPEVLSEERPHPALARDHQARRREKVADAGRRDARRHHRQAARSAYRAATAPACRRSKLPLGRLRGRRLPLKRRQACGRLAAARALRPGRQAQSRRLHLVDPERGQARADQRLEKLIAPPGFTGERARRAESLVDRALGGVEAAQAEARRRGGYDHFSGDRFRHGTKLMRWRGRTNRRRNARWTRLRRRRRI